MGTAIINESLYTITVSRLSFFAVQFTIGICVLGNAHVYIALHPVSKKFPQLQLSQLCKYCVSPVPTSTYQVAGCVRGLYFLYFIFHSIFSLQRAHSPSWPTLRMFLVRWLVSYLVFLKALEFLYFWARVLFALPFWELIVTVFKRKSTQSMTE